MRRGKAGTREVLMAAETRGINTAVTAIEKEVAAIDHTDFPSLRLTETPLESGTDERSIPGNTVDVHADLPFSGLTTLGGAFLSKFECAQMPHLLLDEITIVDTPGVLSGEKQ